MSVLPLKRVTDLKDDKEDDLRSKLSENFHKIAAVSTAHGVPFIFEKSRNICNRLFWTTCLFVSSAACFFLIAKSIENYSNFNTYNTIKVIYDNQIEFPTITICNINSFATNESFSFVNEMREKNNLTDFLGSNAFGAFDEFKDELSRTYLNFINTKYLGQLNSQASLNDEQKKKLGNDFNQTIVTCLFQSEMCTEQDFTWFFSTSYGNCFSFNSGLKRNGEKDEIKKITKPGREDGLVMLVHVGISDDVNSLASSLGAVIFIHNSTITPKYNEGVRVATGADTSIAVVKTIQNYLPTPYNECLENLDRLDAHDSYLFKEIFKSNETYRQRDCRFACFQQQTIETCGCHDINFVQLNSKKACTTPSELKCLNKVYTDYYSASNEECSQLCPLECNRIDYEASISFSAFPTNAYVQFLNSIPTFRERFGKQRNITHEIVKQNFLAVAIYYDELKYTILEESAQTELVDLIGGIGGTLGLFLGVSFLSFAEGIEFLVVAFYLILAKIVANVQVKNKKNAANEKKETKY